MNVELEPAEKSNALPVYFYILLKTSAYFNGIISDKQICKISQTLL